MRTSAPPNVTFPLIAAQFGQKRMKTITELDEATFDRAIAAANVPVVVDFYAPWCGPCKMIAPLLEKLAEHFAGRLQFVKVNVDDAPVLAARFEITGVPSLVFINQGKVREVLVGFSSARELLENLEALAAHPAEAPV
jgi:thioredoxin